LLVRLPSALTDQIRSEFANASIEEARSSDEIEALLRPGSVDVVVIGPDLIDYISIAQQAARADASLSVLILCRLSERSRIVKNVSFSPFLGAEVHVLSLSGGSPIGTALQEACARTRRRREHQALLDELDSKGNGALEISPSRLADRLRETEEQYRVVIETLNDAIVTIDEDSTILFANPATERVFGYAAGELRGRSLTELMPERLRPVHVEALGRYVRSLKQYIRWDRLELVGLHKSGHEIPLEVSFGEHIQNGRRCFTGVLRDISERARWEKELQDSAAELKRRNQELDTANRDLDEFTSVAAHDLQEPLRKLVVFATLLRGDLAQELPEDAERDLEFILDGSRRMQRLVSDLLALSRAGQSAMNLQTISAGPCADRALEDLELQIEESGARIERDALPEVTADATLLTGIFRNLIGNAIKFSGSEHPVIRITAAPSEHGWTLGVRDAGIGVPPHATQEIFKAFRRLNATAPTDGSGIGLAFCRKAVERHGGQIWVEPVKTGGSHFRFTLEGSP
jgi:PAS domain S-box-containing protein